MKHRWLRASAVLVAALVCIAGKSESGQLTYARGQNVVAAFEGWERHADGTFAMVFSYYNRNYEETLDVPIGPENNIEPGGPDQGQPTHFLPGRHRFVFSVKVPKDFDPKKRLVWTLTVRGKTEKANAFLLREWEINNQVRAQNGDSSQGGGGNGLEYNEAPEITPGPAQSIVLPAAATLTASVKDDGLPKPRTRRPAAAGRAGAPPLEAGAASAAPTTPDTPPTAAAGGGAAANGPAAPSGPQLRVNWIMYRGPAGAAVVFKPDKSPVTSGTASTVATFSLPGRYVVRAYADDGAVTSPADIAVTVSPAK
jgi:hypothetical protein